MNLRIEEVTDPIVRDNFQRVESAIGSFPFLKGSWRFVEIEISSATTIKFKHGLRFIPKDVIQTSLIGSGSATWNHQNFTRDHVEITTTGPCVVRAFIGSYSN